MPDARGRRSRPATAVIKAHWDDPLYRQSYLLVLAGGLNAVTSFAFWLIATHFAPPAAVGRAAAAVSAITIVSYATSAGLPYGILRFGARDDALSEIVNGALLLTTLTSAIAAGLFILGLPVWAPGLESLLDQPAEITVFAALCIGTSVVVLLDNLFAARRRSGLAVWRNLGAGAGRLTILVLLSLSGAAGLYVAALGPVAVSAIGAALVLPKVDPTFRIRIGLSPPTRDFFRYSLASFPSSLFGGAPPFVLPLVALAIVGPRETAFFYIAWSIVGVLLLLPTVVANIAVSEGSRGLPWATADRARRFSLLLVVPVILSIGLAAQPILSLFGPGYAAGAANVLRIFLLSLLPWVVMVTDLSALRVQHRYALLLGGNVAFAVLSLTATAVLGLAFGLDGLAVGWTGGLLLAAITVRCLVAGARRAEQVSQASNSADPIAA